MLKLDLLVEDKILLKEILRLSDEAFRLIDLDKNLILCNEAYAVLNNSEVEYIIGKKCNDFICSRNCDSDSCSLEKIRDGEKIIRSKVSFDINGSTRYYNYRVIPVFGSDQKLAGILESFNDITNIEEARIAIEDEKEKFFYFIDQSKDGAAILNEFGAIVSWNKQMEQIFDITEKDALGNEMCEIINNYALDQKLSFAKCFDPKIELSERYRHDKRFSLNLNVNNLIKHVEIEMFPYRTSKGVFAGVIARDTTIAYQNEQQLEVYKANLEELIKERTSELLKSEERLSLALSGTNEGIWEWDIKTGEVYFSPTYYTMAGYEINEFEMKYSSWRERVHEEDIAKTEGIINKHLNDKDSGYEVRFRFRKKNGEYMWILGKGKVVNKNELDEPIKLVGTHTDISNLMQAMESLDFTKRKFEYIFNSALDIIAITDEEGKILEINTKGEDVTGLNKRVLIGSSMDDHLSFTKDEIHTLAKNISDNEGFVYEVTYVTPHDNKIYFEIYSREITYMNEKAFLHIARDVTERKQVQNKLMEIASIVEDKERKRFARDLHDGLGAVMSGIKMYLNLLKNSEVDKEQQNEILDKTIRLVSEAADNARRIANNIRPQEFSKFGMIASIKNFLSNIQQAGEIDFSISDEKLLAKIPEEIEIVLYRVLTELINNTLSHSKATMVVLEIYNIDNVLIINYQDNGIGFDISNINSYDGHGMKNIKGRINSLNGELKINTRKDKGFQAIIKIHI